MRSTETERYVKADDIPEHEKGFPFELLQRKKLHLVYDSVVTLALAFVTLTPSCFAFATISTLFFDETACEILPLVSIALPWVDHVDWVAYSAAKVVLCMRRRSTSLMLLTTKALCPEGIMCRVFLFEPYPIYHITLLAQILMFLCFSLSAPSLYAHSYVTLSSLTRLSRRIFSLRTYLWHSSLALEPSSNSIVDTLRLPPAGIDTHVCVTLVSVEALRVCRTKGQHSDSIHAWLLRLVGSILCLFSHSIN